LVCMSHNTIGGKIVRMKVLQNFGICCYSIYLLHPIVLEYSESAKFFIFNLLNLNNASVDLKFCIWFPIISALCLVPGLLVFYLVERPSVNLGKKVIRLLESRREKTNNIATAQEA